MLVGQDRRREVERGAVRRLVEVQVGLVGQAALPWQRSNGPTCCITSASFRTSTSAHGGQLPVRRPVVHNPITPPRESRQAPPRLRHPESPENASVQQQHLRLQAPAHPRARRDASVSVCPLHQTGAPAVAPLPRTLPAASSVFTYPPQPEQRRTPPRADQLVQARHEGTSRVSNPRRTLGLEILARGQPCVESATVFDTSHLFTFLKQRLCQM